MEARWYQSEAVDSVWNHLCNKPGNPAIVLPTGAGKSLCIAMICRDAIEKFNGRVIVLAHRKELLIQNAGKVKALLPDIPVGMFSAGLGRCDINQPIICGGIQSVYNKAHEFGTRQLVIVDEFHLVPSGGEGMYRTFFSDMRQLNPNLRVVGLSATPFRTGEGKICRPDALFQEVCYSAPIKRLIAEGFLSNLSTEPADASVDTSGLHLRGGEFIPAEMTALFDDDRKIEAACREIVQKTYGRRSTLIFCPGVFHAAKTAKKLEELTGEECGIVTGDSLPLERASTLDRFRRGELKRLTNIDVLTTGFDAPCIDAIAVLRATMSPGLFAQMVGRGLRTSPGKSSCLILDFGENIKRHGPLDSDTYGNQLKGKRQGSGEAPTKNCPACTEPCPISARFCECGWKFPEPELAKHGTNPDGSPILEADVPETRWTVEEVLFSRHKKKNGGPDTPDTLRVDYVCTDSSGGNLARQTISEWVCLEHDGFAQTKAHLWWSARSNAPAPDIDEAISLWKRGAVAGPSSLVTKPNGRFVRIVSVELDPKPETWDEEPDEIFDAFETEVPF